MVKRATIQNAFTKGVLDPRLAERLDLTQYYTGMREATNSIVRPQGSLTRRLGTNVGPDGPVRIRRRLDPVHITAGMLTAYNGGSTANLASQDMAFLFTTTAVNSPEFGVFELDLGVTATVSLVDLIGFRCASSRLDHTLAVEYFDGSQWLTFGAAPTGPSPRRNIRTDVRSRRFGMPPGQSVQTRYLRVRVYNAVGVGAITVAHVRVWTEKRAVSAHRLIRFSRDDAAQFVGVITEHNLDWYRDHKWIAAVGIPVMPYSIPRLASAHSIDTMFLYDAELHTQFVQRQGSDAEWNWQNASFSGLSGLAERTTMSGSQSESQDLTFSGVVSGDVIRLYLGNLVTEPFMYTTPGALPAAITTVLEWLPGVGAGSVFASLTSMSPLTVNVTFQGAAGGRFWPTMAGVVMGVNATATVSAVARQKGVDIAGVLCGERTGFPRCGAIYQGRHYIGGMASAQNTMAATRVGSAFDFTSTGSILTADLGFADTLESGEAEVVRAMYVGRHLLALTNGSVWFCDNRAPAATEPRNWRLGARPGIEEGVPIAMSEGVAHYVQAGGTTLRQLVTEDTIEAAYVSDPANILNPDLVTGVTDCAVADPQRPNQGALILMRRADGTVTCLSVLRSQDLLACTPWRTADGDRFMSVLVDADDQAWSLVERTTAANGADIYLERHANELGLDAAHTFTFDVPVTVVSGLGMHEGRQVWAWVDGDLYGPYTVTGSAITLEKAGRDITAGLFTPWQMEPMPLREKLANGYPFRPPGRIYAADIVVRDTAHLEMSVNGGPWRPVDLMFTGDAPGDAGPFSSGGDPGLPLLERLRTGTIEMRGLRGWSSHPRIALRQTKPAPVEITALRCELAHRG